MKKKPTIVKDGKVLCLVKGAERLMDEREFRANRRAFLAEVTNKARRTYRLTRRRIARKFGFRNNPDVFEREAARAARHREERELVTA